ncbi:PapD-like protein [Staphylotrichum tortipilum]|uniref:PapD-like protein n=1 Tax=Staphylotrichum tortipilum TaxID=2831512 RepID=A0AAN6RUP0_9PEZI|nr:PapD-like protein [Staphylotrichum longicolle]
MSVDIDPQELGFRRPFTVEASQILKIKNPNATPVAFKVKTTAPKQYCVRPNSGRIEPGLEVEVSVVLQSMKQEPPLDAKCRDKFLVQSVTITADKDFTNVAQIWDSVEKSAIQEKKIRVLWLPAAQEGPSQPIATPVRRQLANGFDATPDAPTYSPPQDDTTILDDTTAISHPEPTASRSEPEPATQATQTTAFSVPVGASAGTPLNQDSQDNLRDQLAKAEATIAMLKNEVASGLRQRKASAAAGGVADEKSKSGAQLAQAARQTQGTEGVPVQVVAVLCLTSFLLAYFFF